MTWQQRLNSFMRGFATGGVVIQGIHYATYHPSMMDTFNGLVAAAVILSLWFLREDV